ncbi:hypothetical protein R3P38DRAFT_2829924 [Favolaschia claudopus]|uniref:Uncharacterized protein n=1 Tax=Favolaschia claudopus TaxID=2862362 RepID=A0AAW0E7M6_9AGAR
MLRLAASASASRTLKHGSLISTRCIRMKNNKYLSVNADKEEDLLLERLQEQLKRVKARLAAEEAAKKKGGVDFTKRSPKLKYTPPSAASPAPTLLDTHVSSLWDDVVEPEVQAKLANYKITSMDQLQAAYEEADVDLNRPPYPSVERLKPRLRLAWELYQSIPEQLAIKARRGS